MHIRVLALLVLPSGVVSCTPSRGSTAWPNLPLFVVAESDQYLQRRAYDPALHPLDEVILLPQVAGYESGEGRSRIAFVEPLRCPFGNAPLSSVLSALEGNRQHVSGCIVLSRGYAPTGLGPTWNPGYARGDRKYVLKDIPPLSEEEAAETARIVVKELERGEVRIFDRAVSYKDAISSGAILGATFLESPFLKKGYAASRDCSVLWHSPPRVVSHGDKVPVFVSPSSLKTLRELLGVGDSGWPSWPSMTVRLVDEAAFLSAGRPEIAGASVVDELILLPQVANYVWRGTVHDLALADPIVVQAGEMPIAAALSSLEAGERRVRRCIVLARGFCPGGLFPLFNDIDRRGGESSIRIELPSLPSEDVKRAGEVIIRELEREEIVIRGPGDFLDVIHSDSVLSHCWIESPTVRRSEGDGLPRTARIALWDAYLEGQTIPVCLSTEGMQIIRDFLRGPNQSPSPR